MGKNQANQLDLFSFFENKPINDAPLELFRQEKKNPVETETTFNYLSYPVCPSLWVTSFSGTEDRARKYIDAVGELSEFQTRLHRLIEETRNNPASSLAEKWREIAALQQSLYCRYSGEGGLPISGSLAQAQLLFIRDHQTPAEQRKLLFAGLYAYLEGDFPFSVRPLTESLKSQLKELSSGEISTTRMERFLQMLSEIDETTKGDPRFSNSKRSLSSDEGNGAYYSPEVFQHLLRLIPMTAVSGQEINVLEPNIGKGSLIRPLVHRPGFLIFANDLNPISAEVTELTTKVDPSVMASACEEGRAIPAASNCAVFRHHAFDLHQVFPDHQFDLLIANPPYIFNQAKQAQKREFKRLGLTGTSQGISLAAFTRKILPMKLREGGISVLITSSRSRNFKRVRHAEGLISHPVMILALTGQPFSFNDATLMPISMPAYPFDGEKVSGKSQVKAECFISVNVLVSGRVANGKESPFSECDIIHLDVEDLPVFVRHCLNADQWGALDHQVLGPSMQMLQTANLLRIFLQHQEAIQASLESEIRAARRRYDAAGAKRYQRFLKEIQAKRFHQIGTFEKLSGWIGVLEKRWQIPLQESVGVFLRKNPLRKYFTNHRLNRRQTSGLGGAVKKAFHSILATSNRFHSRFYLLSTIHPIRANAALCRIAGEYNGTCFKTDHPVLGCIPYPFSLYLLNEREIVDVLEAFPEIEQKQILRQLRLRSADLNNNVPMFNQISREAEGLMKTILGEVWYNALRMGDLPGKEHVAALLLSGNPLCEAISQLMRSILLQDAPGLTQINQAMEGLDLLEKQKKYLHYLQNFSETSVTPLKIRNLLVKTETMKNELQKGLEILKGPSRPVRKIRPLHLVS